MADPRPLQVRKVVYIDEMGFDGAKVLHDPLDRRAEHFLALTPEGVPAAAMRIIHGANRPFEFEMLLETPADLSGERQPAEISRLCIASPYRAVNRHQFVHAGMWKIAVEHAASAHLTSYWIWAPPALTRVYEYLGFSQVPGMGFHHPIFNNQFYQVLRIDLVGLREAYRLSKHPLEQLVFG